MNDLLKDSNIDAAIEDIIEIFTKIDGVDLVRISGITRRANKLSGYNFSEQEVDNMIKKLKNAGIINYNYITRCPYCNELSYQITERDISKAKLCDTCNTIYSLIDNTTLIR